MNNFITLITTLDPRFTIGWALLWFGLGTAITATFWGLEKRAEKKIADRLIDTVLAGIDLFENLGHVIDNHPYGPVEEDLVHAHCICGEMSTEFKAGDETGEALMELWAGEHIDSLMESSGR